MEIQTGDAIKDLLHKLSGQAASITSPSHSFGGLLASAAELIDLYNDKELVQAHKGNLSTEEYQHFLLTHLILLDTTNARFLWKRIPKGLKEVEGAAPPTYTHILGEVWSIGKSLILKEFGKTFVQIKGLISHLESDSEKNSFAQTVELLKILEKTLRQYHVFKLARKTYITIEYSQFRELFGFSATEDAAAQDFISKRGLTVEGSYVHIPSKLRGIDDIEGASGQKQFHLSEDRIQDLARVVQYLEKKKITFE